MPSTTRSLNRNVQLTNCFPRLSAFTESPSEVRQVTRAIRDSRRSGQERDGREQGQARDRRGGVDVAHPVSPAFLARILWFLLKPEHLPFSIFKSP